MAVTATIALNPSTVKTGQKCTASVTFTNGSAFPVNITGFQGTAKAVSSEASTINTGVSIGQMTFGPNADVTVPASSTLVKTFDLRFQGPASGSIVDAVDTFQEVYDVSGTGYASDNSVFSPSAAQATVNYVVTFPAAQQ